MPPGKLSQRETRWRADPTAFVREALIDPETGRAFELYAEEERFLREALTVGKNGRMSFSELVYSGPKKSGKTAFAAMSLLYVVIVLGGPYAEGYAIANDFEQAQGRVFQAAARIAEASPMLREGAKITANQIEFLNSGATITAIASDYAGAAGSNPTISVFDELWGVTSERGQRLFDEMVPVPTRKISLRLTVTYAGFSGESELLERLYKRGLEGEEIAPDLRRSDGMLMYWTHRACAPWQDQRWLDQMRGQLRPNAFLRLIENRWVTSESTFVPMEAYDACVDAELHPSLADPALSIWAGVDASVKHDSTAIVCCTFDSKIKKVKLIWHKVFQPTPDDPLNFEQTIEQTLIDLRRRFYCREIFYDPYQMAASSQRLIAAGLPMTEFAQTTGNLTEASQNLYELIVGRNLAVYPDDDLRLAISRAVATESSRGWKISKEKQSHRIDIVVALAQACLGAVRNQVAPEYAFIPCPRNGRVPFIGDSTLGRQQRLDREDDLRQAAGRYSRAAAARRHGRWAGY